MCEDCSCHSLVFEDVEKELIFLGVGVFTETYFYKCPKCGYIYGVSGIY
jgi:hypothetical protein